MWERITLISGLNLFVDPAKQLVLGVLTHVEPLTEFFNNLFRNLSLVNSKKLHILPTIEFHFEDAERFLLFRDLVLGFLLLGAGIDLLSSLSEWFARADLYSGGVGSQVSASVPSHLLRLIWFSSVVDISRTNAFGSLTLLWIGSQWFSLVAKRILLPNVFFLGRKSGRWLTLGFHGFKDIWLNCWSGRPDL